MTQNHQFAILFPLVVGAMAFAFTILVQVVALSSTLNLVRRQKSLGRTGAGTLGDLAIISWAVSLAFVGHLVQIAFWAVLLIMFGEFQEFGSAYYHPAVNFTTLGYGDLVLTPSWRLLGPLEATNGMLMFGVSAAMVFAVIQRLAKVRFTDLRD